jgi:monoamine oxidase
VLAFVASACPPERDRVQDAVLAQAREQPGPDGHAGTAQAGRAGDYVDGPYPATLEGAVRSGARAAANLA